MCLTSYSVYISLATPQGTSKLEHRLSSSKSTRQLELPSSTPEVAAHDLELGRLPRASTAWPVVDAYLALCRLPFRPLTRVLHRSSVAFSQEPVASASLRPRAIFNPALPPTNRATADMRLKTAAQPRPSSRFVPHCPLKTRSV